MDCVYVGRNRPQRGVGETLPTHRQQVASVSRRRRRACVAKGGGELFYLRPDGTLMAVEIQDELTRLTFAPPQPLFQAGRQPGGGQNRYDVTKDGQRFLVL